METPFYQRTECRVCNSPIRPVLYLVATPSGDKYLPEARMGEVQEEVPLDLYLCEECGLAQLAYVIDPEALYGDYIYETSVSLGLSNHFKDYAKDAVQRLKLAEGGLVVDIGSNDGTLLRHFVELGQKALGVEPSPAGDKARATGIETVGEYFSETVATRVLHEYGPASLVTANNVLANIDSLDGVLRGIRDLLAPDGVFVFETFYLVDVLQHFLPETIFHEHLCYFTVNPLMVLFERYDMELFDAERVDSKGGSLRGFVQLAGGTRKTTSRVGEVLEQERRMRVATPAAFADFAETLQQKKARLSECLRELKDQGKTIVGYGASVGVTTLLYQFGITDWLDYLVDDNPAKHHRLSPGHQLQVLPSEILYERQPDYVLIMAWGYAEPIMGRHQRYVEEGGHFILPLPELRLV
jgi:SAM-dependent methyltransferase